MSVYSFYHLETGRLHGSTFSTDVADSVQHEIALRLNTPSGHAPIAGAHDPMRKAVDLVTQVVIEAKPPEKAGDDAQQQQIAALRQIARLEHRANRAVREAILGSREAAARLKVIDGEIAALRKQLIGSQP